jgi:hypothetical protein
MGHQTATTQLDRDGWSYGRCEAKCGRTQQVTIDIHWDNPRHGAYQSYCWQCYWVAERWRRGPIINCGAAWDGVDVRRKTEG